MVGEPPPTVSDGDPKIKILMTEISSNLTTIRQNIQTYCKQYDRDPASVELVAIGKKHSVDKILTFARLGQHHFGENYLQEAEGKINHIATRASQISKQLVWHFIGHIQSRKCKDIANQFHWVHSVDSFKVANKLNAYRQGKPLNVLVQVNIDQEETKSGILPENLATVADQISPLPNILLRGLMIIPRTRTEFDQQRQVFRRCRMLMDELNATGHQMDQLSMGMTGDLEAAIAEGATQVRIGTALFGERPASI